MKIHELKTDPDSFDSAIYGVKGVEIRFDDRNYQVGDLLVLRRTAMSGKTMKESGSPVTYTGRYIVAKVTHIQSEMVKDGWVALSIHILTTGEW